MTSNHTFAADFSYEASDVPPGKSLREWRRENCERTRRRRRRVKSRFQLPSAHQLPAAR